MLRLKTKNTLDIYNMTMDLSQSIFFSHSDVTDFSLSALQSLMHCAP